MSKLHCHTACVSLLKLVFTTATTLCGPGKEVIIIHVLQLAAKEHEACGPVSEQDGKDLMGASSQIHFKKKENKNPHLVHQLVHISFGHPIMDLQMHLGRLLMRFPIMQASGLSGVVLGERLNHPSKLMCASGESCWIPV